MKINFGGWPEEIHSDFEQVKRIESSKKLKKDVVSLDLDFGQVIIQGSGSDPYKATLHECTCPDFAIRQAPCKHMYYLAGEMGILKDFPVYKKKESSFDPYAEMIRYKNLFESGEISGESYVKICTALSKIK